MTRRPNNLDARVSKLERFRRPKGTPFFMIWSKSDGELMNAISTAKANGDLRVGDKFDAKIWTHPAEPPPPRLITLAEMERDELVIIAGGENHFSLNNLAQNALIDMTDADLSDWYVESLPTVV